MKLERLCANIECGKVFYCSGECRDAKQIVDKTNCYCPTCYQKHKDSLKHHCKTRMLKPNFIFR